MTKEYARQVPCEYQNPSYSVNDMFKNNDIALFTNSEFKNYVRLPEVVSDVREEIADETIGWCLNHKDDPNAGKMSNDRYIIEYYMPSQKGEPYSDEDIDGLTILFKEMSKVYSNDNDWYFRNLTAIVSIVTGKKWDYRQIKGCCQRDWAYVIYDSSAWDTEAIRNFEIEYFNLGSEWVIHDDVYESKPSYNINDNVNNREVIKMTLEEFLAKRGLESPIDNYLIDKLKGNRQLKTSRGAKKFNMEADKARNAYQDQRRKAINEYNELVSKGKIKPKTRIERELDTAHGHPDNTSTQAARRMLAKRGIDWKTGLKKKD